MPVFFISIVMKIHIQSINDDKGGIFMNIDIRSWSYKKLGEIFDKDILIKAFTNYKHHFEIFDEESTKCIEVQPKKMGIVIPFDQKKNASHPYSMLNDTIMKFIITSIFAILLINILNISFSNAEKPTVNYVNIQVSSGDTVWSIASRYASDKEDIRELVYTIKTINDLNHSASIYAGQTLKVPTNASSKGEFRISTNNFKNEF